MQAYLIVVDESLCTIATWAKSGPHTYYQMLLLIYAEKRRVLRACSYAARLDPKIFREPLFKHKERHELYNMAIQSASEDGNVMHLALGHELIMRCEEITRERDI